MRRRFEDYHVLNDYFKWLANKLHIHKNDFPYWKKLFEILYFIPYEPYHRLDENRAMDGAYLRDEYFRKSNYGPDLGIFKQHISVLEVLSELAIRCDSEYIGNPKHPKPYKILEDWLDNLGVDPYDRNLSRREDDVVDAILEWMIEKPEKVFGLKITKSQREIKQLWDLMVFWAGNQ